MCSLSSSRALRGSVEDGAARGSGRDIRYGLHLGGGDLCRFRCPYRGHPSGHGGPVSIPARAPTSLVRGLVYKAIVLDMLLT